MTPLSFIVRTLPSRSAPKPRRAHPAFGRTLRAAAVPVAVCVLALAPRCSRAADQPGPSNTLRLGISTTLFHGMPESLVIAVMKPFDGLLFEQTGMSGALLPSGDGASVAQALTDGRLDVGVVEGIEFAWARQRHPELRPLMVTINQEDRLHACVVVPKDSPARRAADLRGKPVALFRNCREHCRLYLGHHGRQAGLNPESFFSQVKCADNAEAALDDVVDGAVAGAVVDTLALECFRRRKPGRFDRLKVLERSPPFPASVVVYRDGTLGEATRQKFQQGMLNANKSILGRQMLMIWKLTAFAPVPGDYEQTLVDIVKVFPAPVKPVDGRAGRGRVEGAEGGADLAEGRRD